MQSWPPFPIPRHLPKLSWLWLGLALWNFLAVLGRLTIGQPEGYPLSVFQFLGFVLFSILYGWTLERWKRGPTILQEELDPVDKWLGSAVRVFGILVLVCVTLGAYRLAPSVLSIRESSPLTSAGLFALGSIVVCLLAILVFSGRKLPWFARELIANGLILTFCLLLVLIHFAVRDYETAEWSVRMAFGKWIPVEPSALLVIFAVIVGVPCLRNLIRLLLHPRR